MDSGMIGGGAKLSLAKIADPDVHKVVVIKLQNRVKTGAATLLIKVKAHKEGTRWTEVDTD